jgi:alanyl-tRNA synthetase
MVSVDLSTPVLLTAAQIQDIETETNRMVASGAAVNWKMFTKEQILSIGNSGAQSGADDTSELSLLRGGPKGAALELDELRMVHIDGLDLNPCGGTHLRSLSEINVLKVMGFDKDNNRGCVRVRFLAGQRALNYFRDCIGRETFLSSQLSVPPAQHPEAIEKLLKEKRDNAKRMDIYAEELAELFALSLLVNPEKALNCKVADGVASLPETPVYAYHRPGADLKFLVKAAGTLLAAYQKQNPSSKTSPLVYLSGDEQMPVYVSAVEPPKGNAKAAKKPAAGKGGKAAEAEGGSKAAEGGLSGAFVLFGTEALVQQLKEPLVGTSR